MTLYIGVIIYFIGSISSSQSTLYDIKVKDVHVILEENMICLHTNSDTHFSLTNDFTPHEMNIAILFEDRLHNLYQQKLKPFKECHSENLMMNDTSDSTMQENVFCGRMENILPWANTFDAEKNLQQYSELKVIAVHGNITFNSREREIKLFLRASKRVNIFLNMHGFDPCRVDNVREDKCEGSCIPSCKLYANGEGKVKCGKQIKSYRNVRPFKEENYTDVFQFHVEQVHMDEEGVVCIQMKLDTGSHCYVDAFQHVLSFENKETNQPLSLPSTSECTPLFYKDGFSGSFCFKADDAAMKSYETFTPKSLQLNNLVMYCNKFSVQRTTLKNISLEAVNIKRYKMLKFYDICPHALKEKGLRHRRNGALIIEKGFLVESYATNTAAKEFSFVTVSAIVIVIIFLIAVLASFLLCKAQKQGRYFFDGI